MNRDSRKSFQEFKSLGELSVIGMTLVVATLIGYGIGYWAEHRWPFLAPWGGIAGALLGIVAGFIEMFRTIRRITRCLNEADAKKTASHESNSRNAPH